MGSPDAVKTYTTPESPLRLRPLRLERARPRRFEEWKTLRGWNLLPLWEQGRAGYVLRDLRERSRLTQAELATKLGCSQQAIAQAERWESNPTLRHMERWAEACGKHLEIRFQRGDSRGLPPS